MPDQPNAPLAPISSRAADAARDAWGSFPALHNANSSSKGLSPGSATAWGLSERAPLTQRPPISLGGGIPDADTQPRAELLAAMERVLSEPGDAPLVYGGPLGYEPLRDEVARYFARNHPASPNADWYLLTNGAAGAIESICAAFVNPGDIIITEIPTFTGSLRTMRGKQATVVGVGMDDEGLKLDELEATIDRLEAEGKTVKLIYTQPTFHNPTGLTMTLQRRLDLIEVAARRQVLLMEDHAYSELYFDAPPPPHPLGVDRRLGRAHRRHVLQGDRHGSARSAGSRRGRSGSRRWCRRASTWATVRLLHRMLHEYMVRGDFRDHVDRMRLLYQTQDEHADGGAQAVRRAVLRRDRTDRRVLSLVEPARRSDRGPGARHRRRRRPDLPLRQPLLSRQRVRRRRRVAAPLLLLAAD